MVMLKVRTFERKFVDLDNKGVSLTHKNFNGFLSDCVVSFVFNIFKYFGNTLKNCHFIEV